MRVETSWEDLKNKIKVGTLLKGIVVEHKPYGIYLDIGYNYRGLIQITDFKDYEIMTVDEYPNKGDEIEAVVLGFKEHGQQVWLGVKPSQLQKK